MVKLSEKEFNNWFAEFMKNNNINGPIDSIIAKGKELGFINNEKTVIEKWNKLKEDIIFHKNKFFGKYTGGILTEDIKIKIILDNVQVIIDDLIKELPKK